MNSSGLKYPRSPKINFLWVPLTYALISSIYIFISTAYFSETLEYTFDIYNIKLIKGLLFVLATSALLFVLLYFEERSHKQANLNFQNIVESQADAVFLIRLPERVIIYANAAAENLFQYRKDEIQGQSSKILHVDEEHYQEFDRQGAFSLSRGDAFHTEFQLRKKDGTIFISEHKVTKFSNSDSDEYAVSVVRDVSERQKFIQGIRDREELLRQLAENIREVFWVSDPQKSKLLYVSPAYEEIWGKTFESLEQNPLSFLEAIHPDDKERVANSIKGQAIDLYDEEYRIIRPDGSIRWIRDRSFPITDAQGTVYRIAGLAEDISTNKEQENRLRQSQKLESIGRLTGGIAHDFNNLLLVILGNVELLREEIDDNTEAAEFARLIERAGLRAADLIDRMLTFSRQKPLAPSRVNVNATLTEIERFLKPSLGEDITVVLTLAEQPTPVLTDGSYLESSIMNLAVNARDAMPEGGRLTIETSVVDLTDRDTQQYADLKPGRYVQITISDTGTGIAAEHLQQVFDPFYTTKEAGKGTGLGLSMVYGFAKESRGQATIYSEIGIGTTVRLYLPYCGEQEPNSDEQTTLGPLPEGTETILVAEDDDLVRSYVCTQLSSLGYRTLEASNAAEALEIVDTTTHIDLIFTDVVMPGEMNGPDLAREARIRRPGVKVLFTTGYADRVAVSRLGAIQASVVTKPYRPSRLANAIRKVLDCNDAVPS